MEALLSLKTSKIKARALVLLALGLSASACGDDTEKGPTGNSIVDGSVFTPSIDAGTPSQPGPSTGNQGDATTPTTPVTGIDSGAPSADCKGTNGCYSCKPATSAQFLNACAEGCQKFDNSKRIPGFTGTLPPIGQ
jgi:hypothetical protein